MTTEKKLLLGSKGSCLAMQIQRRDYWNVQLGAEDQKENVRRRCWVREVVWV